MEISHFLFFSRGKEEKFAPKREIFTLSTILIEETIKTNISLKLSINDLLSKKKLPEKAA